MSAGGGVVRKAQDAVSDEDDEVEKILAMSDEEILEDARKRGIDTEEYAAKMRAWLGGVHVPGNR